MDEAFSRADEDVEDGLVAHQRVFEHYHRGFIGRFPCHRYYRLNHNHAIVAGVVYARFQLQQIEAILRERE